MFIVVRISDKSDLYKYRLGRNRGFLYHGNSTRSTKQRQNCTLFALIGMSWSDSYNFYVIGRVLIDIEAQGFIFNKILKNKEISTMIAGSVNRLIIHALRKANDKTNI